MAKLQPFLAQGTQTGSKENIEVKVLFTWPSVGSGQFTAVSDYNAVFTGQIDSAFYKGPMSLSLSLSDQNPSSQRGPASITLNGTADPQATYQVSRNQIVISASLDGKSETIAINAGDGGTYLSLSGAVSHTVFLKPS
ncbi:hypothetical protein [Stigmatella erecta]|uniref:Uncharacterized protein n=1 Tax=Stigmatella erecta TaxID=83460 RepID=A0A1I0FI65_9BACT|nr:hypothetical protein [Stigmatella erecta]SET57932.1 hypothetical protein SAMN05443639_103425 [Stigmatella erecta]